MSDDWRPAGGGSSRFGCGAVILTLVGLFLLLVPGGCALTGLVMASGSLSRGSLSEAVNVLVFVLFNGALAYGGFVMIRNANR
jgi:hypothetical protein